MQAGLSRLTTAVGIARTDDDRVRGIWTRLVNAIVGDEIEMDPVLGLLGLVDRGETQTGEGV